MKKKKTKAIKIIDNFLDKELFKKLQNFLLGDECPWFYNESKVIFEKGRPLFAPLKDYPSESQHQFTHTFLGNHLNQSWSSYTPHIAVLLHKIKPRVWIRVKSNLTNVTSKAGVSGWHYDNITDGVPWKDTTTAIFYVNTNNGYTIFENEKKVSSLENRIAIFPNNILHSGVSQTDTKTRVTINLNYLGGKKI